MPISLDEQLASFREKDYTFRLCSAIDRLLPDTPELRFFNSLDAAVKVLAPGAGSGVLERAQKISERDGPQQVLKIAAALDRADAGLSIYTGISSAVKLYQKTDRNQALESDKQQAMDAVLKGLGLAWMAHELFPGSFPERVRRFMDLDSGKHLATYYAAIEVGLPFADNAASGAGGLLSSLFQRYEGSQVEKLAAVTGAGEAASATEMAHAMLAPMEGMIQKSAAYLGSLAQVASEFAPKAASMADQVASVAAAGADALPVWRFLGARLSAEYCVLLAIEEVGMDAITSPPLTSPPLTSPSTDLALLAPPVPVLPAPRSSAGPMVLFIAAAALAAGLAIFALQAAPKSTAPTESAGSSLHEEDPGGSSTGSTEEDPSHKPREKDPPHKAKPDNRGKASKR